MQINYYIYINKLFILYLYGYNFNNDFLKTKLNHNFYLLLKI